MATPGGGRQANQQTDKQENRKAGEGLDGRVVVVPPRSGREQAVKREAAVGMRFVARSLVLAVLGGVLVVACGGLTIEPGADLAEADLSERDLSGVDLTGADLSRANLRLANLSGAKLEGVDLTNADLSQANLREAWLTGAKLNGAILDGADLEGASLGGADLADGDLSQANLQGANLGDANLRAATLAGADLRGANLEKANLASANLRGADLRGAKLRYANLEGATLAEAKLGEANVRGANLASADLRGADLKEVNLHQAASLIAANLQGTDLGQQNLGGVDLSGADLSNADLRAANLERATLQGAALTGADLTGADLRRADLTEATLSGAILDGANLVGGKGVTDELLAAAASVTDLRLEEWSTIVDTMEPACMGQGIEQAAAYTGGPGVHRVILVTLVQPASSGDLFDWRAKLRDFTNELPSGWEPLAVRWTELVACIEEQELVLETCQYTGPSITRYQYEMVVRLVEARTGMTIATHSLSGDLPRECQQTEDYWLTRLEGSPVPFSGVKDWLAQFVSP